MNDMSFKLDQYAAIDPEPACWLWSTENYVDGEDYCRECAEEQINYFGNGTAVDGGYGSHEMDGCCHCATCGKLLDYTLTNHGVDSEIAHFRTVRFRKPLSREEAYHVARMIAGAAPDDDGAIKIAKRALHAIPQPLI